MSNIKIGDRVAIMRGFQSVGGPGIAQFGTVVKITNPWDDTDADAFSYMVTGDDGETGYLLGWMLRPFNADGTLSFQSHDFNYGDDVTDPQDPPAGDEDPLDSLDYMQDDEHDNPCNFAGGGGYCEAQEGHDGPHDIDQTRGILRNGGYAWFE